MAKYLLVHQALRRLEAIRNRDPHPLMARYLIPYPLSVGTVRAGDWASTVPDLLVAEGRLGVALGENPVSARQELEGSSPGLSRMVYGAPFGSDRRLLTVGGVPTLEVRGSAPGGNARRTHVEDRA